MAAVNTVKGTAVRLTMLDFDFVDFANRDSHLPEPYSGVTKVFVFIFHAF